MSSSKHSNFLLIVAIAIFFTAVVFKIAYSSPDIEVETTVDTVLTGGDVITGDLSTRGGIAVSGSDMEIADSLATHSILFGLWQGTHTNPYAEADKAEARGNHQAAAEMRCSTKKYRKVYGKGQDCIDAVIYIAPTEITPQTPEDDARIDALYAIVSEMEAEMVQDKANTEKAVKKAEAQAQRANAMAQRVQTQQQTPDDGALRRARAIAAHQKAKEDYEKED